MDISKETLEKKEPVENRSTKQMLIDTAEECRLLKDEADKAEEEKDYMLYKEKLVERGNFILRLPKKLAQARDIETLENRQEILNEVELWSLLAEKALENRGTIHFGLSLLLSPKDDNLGDKDPFETLIESIEK